MIVHYRGYELRAAREECLGGWPLLYFSIYRDEGGYCCVEDFEDSEEYVRDKIKQLKGLVDDALASDDPDYWNHECEYV